jgi:hypothetical protein
MTSKPKLDPKITTWLNSLAASRQTPQKVNLVPPPPPPPPLPATNTYAMGDYGRRASGLARARFVAEHGKVPKFIPVRGSRANPWKKRVKKVKRMSSPANVEDAMIDVGGPGPVPANVLGVPSADYSDYYSYRAGPVGPSDKKGYWHPLKVVKRTLTELLPASYWSTYPKTVYLGADGKFTKAGMGHPVTRIATKIKWRKVLGEVVNLHGTGVKAYTKGRFQEYENTKRQRQALSQRLGWKFFSHSARTGRKRRRRRR